ncbi:hypothetical protein M427DRAFT_160256 [Gonapodya prolifera JEL478]|uniref:C2H2-type domain-containing protein n=1 Tax=Gonapodya prolifera (strain JEL478) TaxID=1344416 RepID=A0A138ZYW2_GONPJ|nr:hypothetical protein M427DRAFT_160256 [Gonapodya prolifera JEL478]|eukprot:KXS09697.1 hypothetical protein M427DRAFT_160256 [Gonapodya prolifera JEL478]
MGRGRGRKHTPFTIVVDSWVKSFPCPKCSRVFTRKDVMVRHTRRRICGREAALRATERLIGEASERTQTVGPALVLASRPEGNLPAPIQPSSGQRRPVSILDALPSLQGDIPPSNLIGPSRWLPEYPTSTAMLYYLRHESLSPRGETPSAAQFSTHFTSGRWLQEPAPYLEPPTYPSIPQVPFPSRLPI